MNTAQLIGILLVGAGAVISLMGVGAVVGVPMIIGGIGIIFFDGVVGGAINLGLLATGKHKEQALNSGDTTGPLFQGVERETVQPNSFTYYDFNVPQLESGKVVAELNIRVFGDGAVNVIFTTQDERTRFRGEGNIRILDKLTEYDVKESTISGLLPAGEWSVILDNTGGIGNVDGSRAVDVEMEYEIRR